MNIVFCGKSGELAKDFKKIPKSWLITILSKIECSKLITKFGWWVKGREFQDIGKAKEDNIWLKRVYIRGYIY